MLSSVLRSANSHLIRYLAAALLRELAEEEAGPAFSVRFWDGSCTEPRHPPPFTLVLHDPSALRVLFDAPDELTLGECFMRGHIDVEGDLQAAFALAERLMTYQPSATQQAILHRLAACLPEENTEMQGHLGEGDGALHSRERDRAAIAYHYDVSNEFYRLWLDRSMLYSAGYFERTDDTLEAAQLHKLDYLCRKLRLQPGEKLLDIGCGWGGLILHAASHYGVEACGVTVSVRQAELAQERIEAAGMSSRCAVRICDYRDLEGAERYDKICSIGMFEHVGEPMLGSYFEQAWRMLRPGGVFLNSGIAASATYRRPGASFIDEYVFPDGDLVPLYSALQQAERCGFEVRDVEELREHYALTLDRWVEALERHSDEAKRHTGDMTYRIWRLYMAAAARAFRQGRIHLYHTLLSKPEAGECHLPLTRTDWYEDTVQARAA
ncbi:SAM-dependent methyltransferase [Paracidobacterium acidisoli]|nr:cyclopropane-fatty-acyl-phospholipid synthase family protein [Paracidobacterium acidisoli]MBT9332269.1 cyclopropane-fatty-acyl-phospholipid synthase family protein [Paracidobacterium acidisoli]